MVEKDNNSEDAYSRDEKGFSVKIIRDRRTGSSIAAEIILGEDEIQSDHVKVHSLASKQAKLRQELQRLMHRNPDSPRTSEIRGEMMENRLGDEGLRALNKRIHKKNQTRQTSPYGQARKKLG